MDNMTKEMMEEKKRLEEMRQKYQEQIFLHYLEAGPDILVLGHCNVTKNKIIAIEDHTDSKLIKRLGDDRNAFFTGVGAMIPNELARKRFYEKFLNAPTLAAFEEGKREIVQKCYMQPPSFREGKYVQVKVDLIETPGTGDVTGIFTIEDTTEAVIREMIFHKMSEQTYDFVIDVDLLHNCYRVVSGKEEGRKEKKHNFRETIFHIQNQIVLESDREYFAKMLDFEYMQEELLKHPMYSFLYSTSNENGDVLTKNMSVSAIDLRIGRVCLVGTDVTEMLAAERKSKYQLEEALLEAKKANLAKSEFLSSMSHDIRTPLNAILGMTALAQANLGNEEKIQDYLKKIEIASQHLLSLVNDVLDMSQLEQSRLHLNIQPISIYDLIDEINAIMRNVAKTSGLRFVIDHGTIAHENFYGDILRMKQILINLLSNAIKFTGEGGKVEFRIEELESSEVDRINYRFTVSDTGIGISKEFKENIFEPFSRSSKVTKVQGTGLGLSITKGLVTMMGGTIAVESKPNKGTVFQVDLSFQQAEERVRKAAHPKTILQEESLKGLHFLLVEDNAINSQILGELLEMRGATFTLKEDGQQAVEEFEKCKEGTYDAIFMDIQMPIMNGYDATKAIRSSSHPDAKKIVIIAMTANAFSEDVQKAMEAGMDAHIAKPVDMQYVCNILKQLL